MKFPGQQKLSVTQIKAAELGWLVANATRGVLLHFGSDHQTSGGPGGHVGRLDTTVQNIRLTFEASGIEFLNEGEGWVGVMFRKPELKRGQPRTMRRDHDRFCKRCSERRN
jgi:hypothetical protein